MFYVYMLLRPWNRTPCYIGKGHGDRVHQHAALGDRHKNRHLAAIIKRAGGVLPFIILMTTENEAEAFACEIKFIMAIGRSDLGLGPLCNLTDGGEGKLGSVLSPEGRAKVSDAQSGRLKSEETKRKISASLVGKGPSEETILKRRLTAEARSEEQQAAITQNRSLAQMGHPVTPETRSRIAGKLVGRKRPPEVIAKVAATVLAKKLNKQF